MAHETSSEDDDITVLWEISGWEVSPHPEGLGQRSEFQLNKLSASRILALNTYVPTNEPRGCACSCGLRPASASGPGFHGYKSAHTVSWLLIDQHDAGD